MSNTNNEECALHVRQPVGGFYFIGFFNSVKEAKKHATSTVNPDAESCTEFAIITNFSSTIKFLA